MNDLEQFEAIFECVRGIPAGQVMSYGQVGDLTGSSARVVGWAMQQVPEGVPWQRVVGSDGYLRIGKRSIELQQLQRHLLESEGIQFTKENYVDMPRHQSGYKPRTDTLTLFE